MKKFLLVVFIGMAVLLNVYGLVNEFLVNEVKMDDSIHRYYTVVYME